MDNKTKFINQILIAMQPHLDNHALNQLENVLIKQFEKYNISQEYTEVAVSDNSQIAILKRFIATKRVEGKSEKTLVRYADTNRMMLQTIGKQIHEITTYDLRCYLALYKEKRKVSNRTLNGMRRCISTFFSWLTAEEIINRNPCAAISQIKYTKTVKKPFSDTELERLRSACSTIRDRALIEFLYSTGCRVSEVSGLNSSDINFQSNEIIVLGKGNKERTVYITNVCSMYLQEYLNTRTDDNPSLFVWERVPHKRLGSKGIESLLRKLGKETGIKNVHPHRYRRTLATNLLDRGANIQDVAKILGHEDLKTTQIYCTISQNNVKNSYQRYAA